MLLSGPAATVFKYEVPSAAASATKDSAANSALDRFNADLYFKNGSKFGSPAIAPIDKESLGFGVGIDYGGFGLGLLYYPQKNIGLFASLGYPLVSLGANAGIKIRWVSKESPNTRPYFIAMYGYNTAIRVIGAPELNELFYGPSVGFGCDLHPHPEKLKFYTLAILIPIRGAEVDNYLNYLKYNGVIIKNGLSPITISVGIRMIINRFR